MDFSVINKSSAKSFNQQKAILKKLSQGKDVSCQICQQHLAATFITATRAKVSCDKGCTDIELDLI